MKRFNRCVAIAWSFVCMSAAAAPQPGDVVFRDNFDSIPLGLDVTGTLGGWTVTSGTVDVIGTPGYDPRPGHGHYIDMQGSSGQPGVLSIEIPVETSGIYRVDFEWSGNPRGNSGAIEIDTGPGPGTDGTFTILSATADVSFLQSLHDTGLKSNPFVLKFFTPAFVDTLDGRIFPDTGLLLDNVEVTFLQAVPEPASFMLVLIGIVPVGIAARRRHLAPHTRS